MRNSDGGSPSGRMTERRRTSLLVDVEPWDDTFVLQCSRACEASARGRVAVMRETIAQRSTQDVGRRMHSGGCEFGPLRALIPLLLRILSSTGRRKKCITQHI